jgi:riboflavin kinase / FMN adenylyltransferase
MEVVYWDTVATPPATCKGAVVSIGNFDGVHQGHQALLRRLDRVKRRLGTRSLVMTFDPPPQVLLRPELPLVQLTTMPQRLKLLEQFNVDVTIVLVTTPLLLNVASQAFLDNLLGERLQVRGLVEGKNFAFGKNRTGTVETLRAWCLAQDKPLEIVEDVYRQGMRISSSAIRSLLMSGDVRRARRALGRPYALAGSVGHGEERGRKIGFPTANLEHFETLVPAEGVYAAIATVGSQRHAAAVNIGPNPTFGVSQRKVEAHLLDFSGDLYGAEIVLEFIDRLRETRPFPSLSALQDQLREDVRTTRHVANPYLQRVAKHGSLSR